MTDSREHAYPASRLVAYLTILTGAIWVTVVAAAMIFRHLIVPIASGLATPWIILSALGWLVLSFFYMSPGLMAIGYGRALLNAVSADTLRGAVGMFVTFFVLAISAGIVAIFWYTGGLQFVRAQAMILGVVVVAIPGYVLLCRLIITHDRIPSERIRDIISHTTLNIAGVVAFWIAFNVFFIVSWNWSRATSGPLSLYLLSFVFVTVGSGVAVYHIGCRLVGHDPDYKRYVFRGR